MAPRNLFSGTGFKLLQAAEIKSLWWLMLWGKAGHESVK